MKIITVIPSRYDSERFPGKPLKEISGRTMIEHVYRRAEVCPEITDVIVATDDQRIFKRVEAFGGNVVLTNKVHPTGTDRVAEAVSNLGLASEDIVVNVQGDQPAFHPSVISDLLKPMQEDTSLPMCTLKYRIRDQREIDNPNHVKLVTDEKGFALYFSRSPIPFYRSPGTGAVYYKHLGFYAYRPEFLRIFAGLPLGEMEDAEKLEMLRALEHGYKIKVVETEHDSIEIDTPEEIERVEQMLDLP